MLVSTYKTTVATLTTIVMTMMMILKSEPNHYDSENVDDDENYGYMSNNEV